MAVANTDYTELVSTTLVQRNKKFHDNVLNHNALLRWLMEQGNVRTVDGGRTLVEELEYDENATFKYYSGYEVLDMSPSEVFSAAEYAWKQAAVVVTASGLEIRINSGANQMIDLLDARMRNAEKTMKNNVSTGVYSNGTGSNGKQIGGLQLLVADAPGTGIIGGINRQNFTFWQNQFTDDECTDSTKVRGFMNTMWLKLVRGSDRPRIIVGDVLTFGAFWDSLTDLQRITDPRAATSGWESLAFAGPGGTAPFYHDDAAPTKHLYMLNTDYIYFKSHSAANMVPVTRREAWNQDAIAVPIIWQGNMTLGNASLQGVIFDGD